MVLVLVKCGKISNAQVARSAVIAVLKKLSQLSGKSCDNYHEKAVLVVKKICDSYHETAVCFGQKPMRSDILFQTTGEVIQHLLYGFG